MIFLGVVNLLPYRRLPKLVIVLCHIDNSVRFRVRFC